MNPFDKLPREIIPLIFSWLDSPSEWNKLSTVCREFNTVLKGEEVYRDFCNFLWESWNFDKRIKLEKIQEDLIELCEDKGWKWLAFCFTHPVSTTGLGYKLIEETDTSFAILHVGHWNASVLDGWGFTSMFGYQVSLSFGNFSRGTLKEGIERIQNDTRYRGQFELLFDRSTCYHGKGTYQDFQLGWIYEGEWENGYQHGKGIAKWKNGYQYEGIWWRGSPKDEAVHRDIAGCIEKGICTRIVTRGSNEFGQFMILNGGKLWCLSCISVCSKKKVKSTSKPCWQMIGECSCLSQYESCERGTIE